jgi:circadian clock protein KaiB
MTRRTLYKFRLYVADNALNSVQARANLAALCNKYLPDCHEIEVVDVYREPKRALADRIFLTPTVVKLAPSPVCSVVGSLSQTLPLLRAFGLDGGTE